ncbi:MAG: hypothetical protein V2A54_02200, partial [Bacteroidota bacterium]
TAIINDKEYFSEITSEHSLIEFQQIGNLWYPKHFFYNTKWQYYDESTKELRLTNMQYSEFFVNEIITDSVKEIPEDQIYNDFLHSIYTLKSQYDPEFWKDYNLIPDDLLRQAVFKDIEKLKK